MAKTIWIHASVKGCQFISGKLNLEIVCGHYISVGENVHANAVAVRDLNKVLCYTKGMINSSQNALVQIADGWAPIGKFISKIELRNGVSIHRIVNDFSRDGDIECVDTKDEADKLCLLSQRFVSCSMNLGEIAALNGFNIDRISARSLRSLKSVVDAKVERFQITREQLLIDANTKTMILAGR